LPYGKPVANGNIENAVYMQHYSEQIENHLSSLIRKLKETSGQVHEELAQIKAV
jgi:hypothetical protein